MKILYFPVGNKPEILEVENELESLQVLVEGYIEEIPILKEKKIYLYCNEEGNIRELPFNRYVKGIGIKGNFFICQRNQESFTDFDEGNTDEILELIK